MILAYENNEVSLHARVKVKVKKNPQDEGRLVESTVGRFIFNNSIPQDLGYVDRTVDPYSLEVDFVLDKKQIGVVIDKCYRKHGNELTSIMLDNIKNMINLAKMPIAYMQLFILMKALRTCSQCGLLLRSKSVV